MLIVTGNVHLAPCDASAFIYDMITFASTARSRDGCLFFAVAPEDIVNGRMLVAERWRDKAALDAHLAAEDSVECVLRWGGRMRNGLAKFDGLNQRPLMDP